MDAADQQFVDFGGLATLTMYSKRNGFSVPVCQRRDKEIV
jgi:hypothetical protein